MTELVRYEAARKALAEAHRVDEVKSIRDKAEAMRMYGKQANDTELVNWAAEIKIRAERKCGELLGDMAQRGERPQGRRKESHAVTLSDIGLSNKQSSRYQQIAKVPKADFEQHIAEVKDKGGELTSAGVRRLVRAEHVKDIASGVRKQIDVPEGKYGVIYADPPWRYDFAKAQSRQIENQYPTMALDEICALPVQDLASPDCVLFLWATSPKLAEAFSVLDAWGFTYRTCAVWAKPQIGMGYYFRQQHELLLVATQGTPPPALESARPGSVHTESRGKHSKKPDWFRESITAMYPHVPRVELFAREQVKGWESWGNES
jgi:N6-adenosine-specific RNA methylase IME4